MIPTVHVELDPMLPPDATFWVPEDEDIDEEGFGFFRGTWAIVDVPIEEAQRIVEAERELVDLAGDLASDAIAFDHLASALENADDGELPDGLEHLAAEEPLASHFKSGVPPLDGLELGVAGLVYALSAVGCYPAASCRGHTDAHAWSAAPVVLFAAERRRADVLARLANEAGCGFAIDPVRPDLLAIQAASILGLMVLARVIVARAAMFGETGSATEHRPGQLSTMPRPDGVTNDTAAREG